VNPYRLVAAGLGVAMVGLVLLASAPLDALVPGEALATRFGNEYFLAVTLGVLAILVGAAALVRGGPVAQTRMPAAEESVSVPVPGDGLDETVGRWRLLLPVVGARRRRSIRSRLRAAAVESLVRSRPVTRAEATALVESGDWTDDPVAARYLASSGRGGPWLAALARRESPVRYRVRRTVDAIVATDGAEGTAA